MTHSCAVVKSEGTTLVGEGVEAVSLPAASHRGSGVGSSCSRSPAVAAVAEASGSEITVLGL